MREEYVLKRVTQLRKERDWSLYRLAKESDISYSTLSNTFHRNNVPSVSTLMRICEGFGITLSEFFDEGGVMPKQLTTTDQKLLADFHRLPRDDRGLVTAYMQGLLRIASVKGSQEPAQDSTPDPETEMPPEQRQPGSEDGMLPEQQQPGPETEMPPEQQQPGSKDGMPPRLQ